MQGNGLLLSGLQCNSQQHVVSTHLVTMHVLAMSRVPPVGTVGVPISTPSLSLCSGPPLAAPLSGQGGRHDWPGDGDSPSEQGGAKQLLIPYPQGTLLYGTGRTTSKFTLADECEVHVMEGFQLLMPYPQGTLLYGSGRTTSKSTLVDEREVHVVEGFASGQQLGLQLLVLSLRGAGRKRSIAGYVKKG